MEDCIKGSDTVVFFSHDYFSMVPDKNDQLLQAAKIAKEYKIKNFIGITPVEYINYQKMDISDHPVRELNDTINKALEINQNAIFITPDLVFGSNSYFNKFLMQAHGQNMSYFKPEDFTNFKFSPL